MLVFGGIAEVTQAVTTNDSKVAGVVSTNPGFIMNTELSGNRVCIALQGRVPCKVIGPVSKGDLLTTSMQPGHAEVTTSPQIGTIIGKSLENNSTDGLCIVEISVGKM